ncbi:MAG: hybrid sensor histidine kinase/response regulator [Deltaproteobacteria bacterium]|nr:hybrid sensor histidine kinase/response regulator [Deltaproteobacteria bacterium]
MEVKKLHPSSFQINGDQGQAEQKKSYRILVVDDDLPILSVIKDILVHHGYEVVTSTSVDEARQILNSMIPDLIISDIVMPNEDGGALHQLLRKSHELAQIPFIFLTGVTDSEKVREAQELGIDEYMFKPFDTQDLLSLVRGKLKRSEEFHGILDHRMESFRKRVIHTLSHEFRTPLVAVNTGTELLRDQLDKLDRKVLFDLIESIQHGGQRLQHLVEDFITIQQIDSGHAEIVAKRYKKEINFVELLQRSMRSFEDEIAVKDFQRISQPIFDKSIKFHIMVCEPQISEVIHRLLSNALKFGGRSGSIELNIQATSEDASLFIRDHGQGISASAVNEVCGMFTQIDRETKEQQGCGLGLAIVSKYLILNNGFIHFHTPEDGGTIVEIKFPLVKS